MFRDSRPIALRKLMPFSNRTDARKHRTSDSIESDEDPLLDEEAAVTLKRNLFERCNTDTIFFLHLA